VAGGPYPLPRTPTPNPVINEEGPMGEKVWVRFCLAIGAVLFFLGCATAEKEVFPITVDTKMDAQEKFLLQSDRLPDEM